MTLHFPRPRLAPFAAALLGGLLLLTSGDALALSTKESIACSTAKQKAAVKFLAAMQKCHGTATKKEVTVDAECLSDAAAKLNAAFSSAEGKGGCVSTADAGAVTDLMEQAMTSLIAQLPAATCNAEGCVDCVACSQAGGGPCADELAALLAAPGGPELLSCANACGNDSGCANGCFATYPGALDAFIATGRCIFQDTCTVCASCSCGDGNCVEGCGETSASCPSDCVDCAASCGNGACNASCGETAANCPGDCCAPVCGDGFCEAGCGETTATCAGDCAPAGCYPETPTAVAGCNGCACEATVCAMDAYCCNTAWDDYCSRACRDSGLVNCSGTPSFCSEGSFPSCGGDCEFAGPGLTCQPTAGYCLTSRLPCSVDSDCDSEPLIKQCIRCECL